MTQQRTFDLLTMPVEGVAAYWLSLHRLSAGKKSFEELARESEFAAEPFVAYLLDLVFAGTFADDDVARLAELKASQHADLLRRRLELVRICTLDIAAGENPRRTYTRMAALFSAMPISMDEAVDRAQDTLKALTKASKKREQQSGADEEEQQFSCPDISHLSEEEELIPALLFFVVLARRHSKMAARPLLPRISSRFFGDAMMLLIDGFDEAFVRNWLETHSATLLKELGRKMELSILMALAIRNHREYDDAYRIARAYLR